MFMFLMLRPAWNGKGPPTTRGQSAGLAQVGAGQAG